MGKERARKLEARKRRQLSLSMQKTENTAITEKPVRESTGIVNKNKLDSHGAAKKKTVSKSTATKSKGEKK